ncbi:adenylate/guanylate cyclase domain-containing protein [Nocardioides dilutus]
MDTGALLLIVAASVEGALVLVLAGLWLKGRRTQRLLRAKLAAALDASGKKRPPKRLVPTADEFVKGVWETANLVREKGFGGAIRTSIEDLAGWAQVERPALMSLAGPDGRVAILFSDIEGSTELNERLGDREWVRLLARHDSAVRSAVDRHHGQVVKTQGDGFMVAFPTPEDAVRCAIAVQRAFDKGSRRGKATVLVRIGIHYGDVVHRDNDIFGRNVAQAARVAGIASGGEILVSESVAEAVEEREDIVLAEEREVELKGLSGEHVVTVVDWAA